MFQLPSFSYFLPVLRQVGLRGIALLAVLLAGPGHAQQLPAPDSAALVTAAPPLAAAPDVIVRTNGAELPGRVLNITPTLVRYLAPAQPDTLALAASDVQLIRYANGTEEVMQRLVSAPTTTPLAALAASSSPATSGSGRPDTARVLSLAAYSPAERYQLGRADAQHFYKPAKRVFWGTLAGTVGVPVVGGVAAVGALAVKSPKPEELHAPTPRFLLDEDYHKGYVKQAKSAKLNKGLSGFGVGVGVLFVAYAVLAEIMANAFNFNFNMY